MSRVDELRKSRDSLSVKFLEFTRIVSKGKSAIFFEGEDEKYYSIRINTIRPETPWSGVNCSGKSNVIGMRKRIKQHETYKKYPCLFFVDSDFDNNQELLGFPDLYVTPCYSVENLYFTEAAFKRVLSAEFGLSDTCDEIDSFETCMAKYVEIKSQYLDLIEGFNLLIKELRLMEKSGDYVGRLNINNVNIDDLISVDMAGVRKLYSELSPSAIFPELSDDMVVSLDRSKQYFDDKNREAWYRGKQHLEFYRVLLSKLKVDRCKKEGRELFPNRGNVKLQLTKANAISELSQYAETPDCLIDFLKNVDFTIQAA